MVHRKFRNTKRKNKEAAKRRRNQIIISIGFVGLMVFSLFGIFATDQQNQALNFFQYNGYEFEVVTDVYGQAVLQSEVNGQIIDFYSLPQDTFRIPVEGNVTQALFGTQYLVIASEDDPQLVQATDLMRFQFDTSANLLSAAAPLGTNSTQISCLNQSLGIPIIEFTLGNITSIDVESPTCLKVETTYQDIFLVRDRLLFSLLGIVEE